MGLAASQGRFLCLTARNSDLIYEGQQISQQRLALAQEAQEIATQYNEAMSNKKMQVLLLNSEGEQTMQDLTYDLLTLGKKAFGGGLGLRVVDQNGYVVIPGEFVDITKQDGDKEPVTTRYTSVSDFISNCMPDIDQDTIASFGTSLSAAVHYYQEKYTGDKTGYQSASLQTSTKLYKWKKDSNGDCDETAVKTLTDNMCTDKEYIKKMLETAQWTLQKEEVDGSSTKWSSYMWQGSTDISLVSDTEDDAKAESDYQKAMEDLNWKDKVLELRLEQVETQQQAVEKEIHSVNQVIGKNIEDTYKTFSG